jgi:hypothetical protein
MFDQPSMNFILKAPSVPRSSARSDDEIDRAVPHAGTRPRMA